MEDDLDDDDDDDDELIRYIPQSDDELDDDDLDLDVAPEGLGSEQMGHLAEGGWVER